MTGGHRHPIRDPRLDRLSRRVELLLWLTVPIAAWEAFRGPGISRLVWGPWAVGLALILGVHRLRGGPARTLLQWLAGLVGMALSLGALALTVVGVFLITRGSFGILAGMVMIPLGLGTGVWGWGLLATALVDPDRKKRHAVDLAAARSSEAVRRFDALHGPGRKEGAPAGDDAPPASD